MNLLLPCLMDHSVNTYLYSARLQNLDYLSSPKNEFSNENSGNNLTKTLVYKKTIVKFLKCINKYSINNNSNNKYKQ